ncbi:MAG: DMT family transporter [Planctomycetes bacterium]|nr:DMT family transporter [Planctomycetota bacterium]
MARIAFLALSFVIGLFVTVHAGLQTVASLSMRNVVAANVVFWLVGALTASLLALAGGQMAAVRDVALVPPWSLLAGALGACLMLGSAFTLTKIPAAAFFSWVVAAQVATSMAFSQFGLMGSPPRRESRRSRRWARRWPSPARSWRFPAAAKATTPLSRRMLPPPPPRQRPADPVADVPDPRPRPPCAYLAPSLEVSFGVSCTVSVVKPFSDSSKKANR